MSLCIKVLSESEPPSWPLLRFCLRLNWGETQCPQGPNLIASLKTSAINFLNHCIIWWRTYLIHRLYHYVLTTFSKVRWPPHLTVGYLLIIHCRQKISYKHITWLMRVRVFFQPGSVKCRHLTEPGRKNQKVSRISSKCLGNTISLQGMTNCFQNCDRFVDWSRCGWLGSVK